MANQGAIPQSAAVAFNAANAAFKKNDFKVALKQADNALKTSSGFVLEVFEVIHF